jgi:hypothetical protein
LNLPKIRKKLISKEKLKKKNWNNM